MSQSADTTDSQNHRMLGVGKDLLGSSSPTSLQQALRNPVRASSKRCMLFGKLKSQKADLVSQGQPCLFLTSRCHMEIRCHLSWHCIPCLGGNQPVPSSRCLGYVVLTGTQMEISSSWTRTVVTQKCTTYQVGEQGSVSEAAWH